MEQAEWYAMTQGCSLLRLGVLVSNTTAREFYQAVNFVPVLERWRKKL